MKCKNLYVKDITGDGEIFDHPRYSYKCLVNNKEVIPCINCKESRCTYYNPEKD